jgi:hypothetical protein
MRVNQANKRGMIERFKLISICGMSSQVRFILRDNASNAGAIGNESADKFSHSKCSIKTLNPSRIPST